MTNKFAQNRLIKPLVIYFECQIRVQMNIYWPILVRKRPFLIDENHKRLILTKNCIFVPKMSFLRLKMINCWYQINHFHFENHENHHTLYEALHSKIENNQFGKKWNLKIHLMALLSDKNILYPWLRWQVNRLELISLMQTSYSCYL